MKNVKTVSSKNILPGVLARVDASVLLRPRLLARLAKESEPQEPYWKELLAALPPPSARYPEPAPEVLPHSSRFRSEAGRTSPRDPRTHGGPLRVWLRPAARLSTV
jgi:hypothetical protein